MKVFIFLLVMGVCLFSCDPKSSRSRSIPLRQIENETVNKVDTSSIKPVDNFIEE